MTIIEAIETARDLHLPPPESPDEYPDYSRGQADLIGDLYGFTSEDKPDIIRVIRHLDSIARFAVAMLQQPWPSDLSERQIRTMREMGDWLEAQATLAGN
jgi:hypothetical protein